MSYSISISRTELRRTIQAHQLHLGALVHPDVIESYIDHKGSFGGYLGAALFYLGARICSWKAFPMPSTRHGSQIQWQVDTR